MATQDGATAAAQDESPAGGVESPILDGSSTPLAPPAVVDPNHPPVEKKERLGWYMYDWANSAVSSVVISGFLPLLVQECALAAAGFPEVCPNVLTNTATIAAVFNNSGLSPWPTAAYTYNGESDSSLWPSTKCRAWPVSAGGDDSVYCPGLPGNADACLQADGQVGSVYPLRVSDGNTVWEPSAYTAAMVSVSVGLQMFLFVTMGSFADYGPWRKTFLVSLSLIGSLLCILAVTVGVSNWWAGGILIVLINLAYGTSYVFYNGWLPLLAANDPATLSAEPAKRDGVFMDRMNAISSNGMAIGYFGSVLCLLICVGVTVVADTALIAYRINVLIAGLWWAAFACFTFAWLKPRPGPPLPGTGSGASATSQLAQYITMPWRDLYTTFSHAKHLKSTFVFLLCWFAYSDGFNVISSVGAQYANVYINWQPLPKSLGLAGLLIVVPIFAGVGNVFWQWVHNKTGLGPDRIIFINCILMALVPAYGLLGFASRSLGFRRWYDMYLGVILYGFNLGSVQSFARASFASMIPEGSESRFFALFEFTDKGSSWIGPAVVAAVLQSTGNFRLAFVYPVVALLLPMPFLLSIDYRKAELEAKAYAARFHTSGGVATRGGLSVAGHEKEVLVSLGEETGSPTAAAALTDPVTAVPAD